jgi:hypothetical protein
MQLASYRALTPNSTCSRTKYNIIIDAL